jgi:hypothetical protein
LGRNALLFNPKKPTLADYTLTIELNWNNLTDGRIARENGLTSVKRQVTLNIRFNQLEFISMDKFGPFRKANPGNVLKVEGNPFICDHRMAWLQQNAANFASRFPGVICTNDPTHATIFTTNLPLHK